MTVIGKLYKRNETKNQTVGVNDNGQRVCKKYGRTCEVKIRDKDGRPPQINAERNFEEKE